MLPTKTATLHHTNSPAKNRIGKQACITSAHGIMMHGWGGGYQRIRRLDCI
ncbi:MAG: hypothetical protein WHV26_09205 [Spirochaetota bacterium]